MENSITKNKIITSVCVVLLIAVMIYLFQDVFTSNYMEYETLTAEDVVYQDIVKLEAFVVRDEEYIDSSASGTVVPLVADGKRVASGDAVARICKSDEEAADYAALENAKEEREHYITLSNSNDLNSVDMEKLNSEIDESYAELMQSSSTDDYSKLEERISNLEDKLANKQILIDGAVDYSEQISEIDKKISELESKKITPTEVIAPNSGYYVSTIDGLENVVDYEKVTDLSVSDIDSTLKSKGEPAGDKMGKIVGSYKWYIVSTIESKYTKIIEKGDRMKVNIPYYGIEDITVKVEKIDGEQDGRVALVLSCNLMNEVYANMRSIDAELVIEEYSGFKVPQSAVRSVKIDDEETINVVYILRGDLMTARYVEIICTPKDADYVVVKSNSGNYINKETKDLMYYSIKRYDEVIVKGRDLENGKSIG